MPRTVRVAIAALFGLAAASWSAADNSSGVPSTMLAAAFDHGGGPEVLTPHPLPVPKPAAGEVLIALQAAGVGAWEADERRHPAPDTQYPVVLGGDGAGTIAALGPGVRGFKVGDAVYGTGEGFYAQYALARADHLARIPKGIGISEAGILAISGLSALQAIDELLQVKAGDTLIVHGATGGVGTLAIQFAKLRGAKVLATAASDEGLALARRLGADAVVNGRSGDIAGAARRLAPNGVDAVLGLAGGEALERCIDTLRTDGRGRVAYLYGMEPLPKARYGIRMLLYSYISDRHELDQLNQAAEAAKLQVPIAAEYALADAAQAHRRLEAGHFLGKIVLRMRSGS
jgi:NADPH:quinone reductase-like Zn-dependent oxidoreductase